MADGMIPPADLFGGHRDASDPWLHMPRSGTGHSYPLYDGVGTVRGLVDGSATITDTYHLDAWGQELASTGSPRRTSSAEPGAT